MTISFSISLHQVCILLNEWFALKCIHYANSIVWSYARKGVLKWNATTYIRLELLAYYSISLEYYALLIR